MAIVDEQIYETAAHALANLQEPDLSAFDAHAVDLAMSRAFTFNGPRPEWLAGLRQRVAVLSGGLTRLEDGVPTEFPFQVKTPGASYQRLVGLFITRLLIMGTFHPPFQIVGQSSDQR